MCLPPYAIADTSIKRLDLYIITAVRWMMWEALAYAQEHAAAVPLVINLSFGATAGPKDGHGLIERAIADEIERYGTLSTALFGEAFPMRVVLAFGNAYRTQQVALFDAAAGTHSLTWIAPPDDRSPTYAEVRAPAAAGATLALTPPFGTAPVAIAPPPGHHQDLMAGESVRARVYAEPVDGAGRQGFILALHPTAQDAGGHTSPSGLWEISVTAQTGAPDSVISLQIQRDDTPFGYRRRSRQSYFVHDDVNTYDDAVHAYAMPGPDCPITREGTHTAQCGSPAAEGVYVVGAAVAANSAWTIAPRPIRTCASGAVAPPWTGRTGPTLAAVADSSPNAPGVIASGTLSGSTLRLSGPSVAAPQLARALVARLAAAAPPADQAQEVAALLATGWTSPQFDARLGAGVTHGAGFRLTQEPAQAPAAPE